MSSEKPYEPIGSIGLHCKPYIAYAKDVATGKIVAGELIQFACKRFLSDLERDDLEFNEKKVDFIIKFFSILKHYQGRTAGNPFILEPWQQWIVANLHGFYWKGTPNRRYKSAYIQIARKNGKDTFAVVLALAALIADGEAAPQVLFAANSREQTKIAFDMASAFTRQLDPSGKELKVLRNEIKFPKNNGFLKTISSDSSKQDGYSPSAYIVDEFHEMPDDRLLEVIKSGTAFRRNPLGIIITTAGFNLESPCKKERDTGEQVLRGVLQDDAYFYAIYEPDSEDDLESYEVMQKSNPNLGVSVDVDFLKQRLVEMKNNPSKEVFVKTKNFNVWCQSSEVWIPDEKVMTISKPVPDEVFTNESEPETVIGLDLASTGDLCCLSIMTAYEGKFYVKNRYYLPESALTGKYNREMYKRWKKSGDLIITPGNVTDYQKIRTDINELYKNGYRISGIFYDCWNSSQLMIDLTEDGFNCVPIAQNMANLSPATKMLERAVLSEAIVLENNPITRWCFQNVVIKADWNENIKATKSSYQQKIDGVVAIVMALSGWYKTPHYGGEIMIM